MWYVIIAEDAEGSLEKRLETRPSHVERLVTMQEAGRLLVAGPNPAIDSEDPGPAGFTGTVMILDFDSLEEAQAWANADPYVEASVYAKVTVKPFKKVFPQ